MSKPIKRFDKVQVKRPVYEYYNYTKENAPDWMKSHNGRGQVTDGPYFKDQNDKVKHWGIRWEKTGQVQRVCETEITIIKRDMRPVCAK